MKILVFGDVAGNLEKIEKFSRMDFSDYDFAIFSGDLLGMKVFKKIREDRVTKLKISKEQTKKILKDDVEKKELLENEVSNMKKMNKILKVINNKIPVYSVCGNADHTWILSKAKAGKYFWNVHKKIKKVGEFNLIGYNGRSKYIFEDYENPTEHAFDENKALDELTSIFKKSKGKTIFITHAPPFKVLDQVEKKYRKYAVGTYGSRAKRGHIGSIAFRKIDDEFCPFLHIFGHIHECKGLKRLKETTFLNTGSLGEDGCFAEIEIADKIDVKFKKIDA